MGDRKDDDAGRAGADRGTGRLHVGSFELELAREVERLLFPKTPPDCRWCCIAVKSRMAGVLGGDYFDFITLPDSGQALFVGDVTGHGLHASLVMSLIYGFIHRAVLGAFTLHELVVHVNDFLIRFAERSRTLDQYFSSTLFIGIIDPKRLTIDYVSAGHPPALVARRGKVFELHPTSRPLGYFPELDVTIRSFRLEEGDRLLLYTDGIIEAADADGNRFGLERLKRLLAEDETERAAFLDGIFDAMGEFGAPDPPEDDCTALVVDIRGIPA